MKMFKKLMAVVLTGVMAVSMLTGCAITDKLVENAAKEALSTICNGATVTVDSKSDLKKDVNAVKTEMKNWAKANNTTVPTQAILYQVTEHEPAATDSVLYILAKAETTKNKLSDSIDPTVKGLLTMGISKDSKLKITVSDTFSAAKTEGKTATCDYVIIAVRAK